MSILRRLANRIDPPPPPQPIPGVERIARPTPPTHSKVGLSTDQRLARLEGETAFLAAVLAKTTSRRDGRLLPSEHDRIDRIAKR